MQGGVPRCRTILNLRNSINLSSTHLASFHSTPVCKDKRNKKLNYDFRGGQQSSKNYARFATRQKRADAKRALKSLLYNSGDMGKSFQDEEKSWKAFGTSNWGPDVASNPASSVNKGRSKSNSCRAEKIRNHRMRRKFRKGFLSEDDDDDYTETTFHATFGNRWYTWAFNSYESSQKSPPGFDWRENFHRMNDDREDWKANVSDSDEEMCGVGVGFYSDRAILGLPPNGPLKLRDVKNAFHLSALKWHPDKHQGPSQAAAEEKFKSCVDAYKSLCSALSAA